MKLYWINPLSHYVFEGWLRFFDKYFNLEVYDHSYTNINVGKKYNLKDFLIKETHIFGNFFNFYKKPPVAKDTIKIIGDIFTNSLCYNFFFDKNTIFYTEYFEIPGQRLTKTILGRTILNLFRGKKFITFTKQTTNFIGKYGKVLYFPQIYVGKVANKISKPKPQDIKILFVGNMKDWKKNVEFILEVFEKLPKNFYLYLVGAENPKLFNKYKYLFDSGRVKYYGFLPHDKLNEIYSKCDIFFFPSKIDPIGAVVLEAMANGLAIITNQNVGASSYVEGNGIILKGFDKSKYVKIFLDLTQNLNNLTKLKEKSIDLVRQNHRFKNENLMFKRYSELSNLLSSKT